jgi:hypothetical protein
MVTALLLTGLFTLLVLGLLVALVYTMGHIGVDARTHDALAKDTPGQQRFFNASILNFLNLK